MPIVLKELMRHETIETTLKYYVGQDAERTADAAWAAFETSGAAKDAHFCARSAENGPTPPGVKSLKSSGANTSGIGPSRF